MSDAAMSDQISMTPPEGAARKRRSSRSDGSGLSSWSRDELNHAIWDWDHFPESASGACGAGGNEKLRKEALKCHAEFIDRVKSELWRRGPDSRITMECGAGDE